jgi:hypothetical protein
MKVIDRTIDTKLGEELSALDERMSAWHALSCASASSGYENPIVYGPWDTDVMPLLDKTLKAINKINRKGHQNGTGASTKGGEESHYESQFSKAASDG